MNVTETIDFDLPCVRCGYNLRTRPTTADCPECGAGVATSFAEHLAKEPALMALRQRGTDWLARAHAAVTFAAVVNVASAVTGLCYRSSSPPYLPHRGWLLSALWLAPMVGAFVASCWAAWRLAPVLGRPVARVARTALGLALLGLAMVFLNPRWLNFYADLNWQFAGRINDKALVPARFVGVLFLLGWPVAIGMTAAAAARLFWLGRHRACAGLLGVLGGTGAAFAALAVLTIGDNAYSLERAGSDDMMPFMLGPTGTSPGVWTLVCDFRLNNAEDILGVLFVVAFAVAVAWPFYLRGILTRAIRLGALPEDAPRSTPSECPPR